MGYYLIYQHRMISMIFLICYREHDSATTTFSWCTHDTYNLNTYNHNYVVLEVFAKSCRHYYIEFCLQLCVRNNVRITISCRLPYDGLFTIYGRVIILYMHVLRCVYMYVCLTFESSNTRRWEKNTASL